MATKQGSYESGKLGDKILYVVDGRQCERSMPASVANPRTEAQQAHRSAFVEIVRLSSHMTEAHTIGLHRHAQRQHLRTYMDFRKLNKNCFTPDGDIDYPRIVLSYGSVAKVRFTSVSLDDGHTLHLTFDANLNAGNATPTDDLYLFVYCPVLCTGILFDPVPRGAESLTVQLPAEWPVSDLHLYAFLRSRRGYTSDTIYIPLPPLPEK